MPPEQKPTEKLNRLLPAGFERYLSTCGAFATEYNDLSIYESTFGFAALTLAALNIARAYFFVWFSILRLAHDGTLLACSLAH